MVAPNIGLVAMPPEEYHADPCAVPSLNYSTAYALVAKSPAHAYLQHPRLGGKGMEPTAAMDEGSLMHELILRDDAELKERIVQVNADDWRTKAAKAQRDEARAAGKLPVLVHVYEEARIACAHVMARMLDLGVKLKGASEIAAFWQEQASDGTTVQCRGMFDHVIPAEGIIYDLKKSRTAHPKAIRKHVEGYGYHIQAAAYTRALERIDPKLAGKVQFRWLFIESEAPYGVTIAEPAGSMRRLGEACWTQAVDQWAHCTAVNDWPAYPRDVVRVEASPWALEGAFTDDEGEVAA